MVTLVQLEVCIQYLWKREVPMEKVNTDPLAIRHCLAETGTAKAEGSLVLFT